LETHAAPARPADLATLNCLRFAFYPYGHDWRFAATDGETVSVRVGGNLVTHSGETLRLLTLAGHGVPGAEFPGGGGSGAGAAGAVADGLSADGIRDQCDLSGSASSVGEGAAVY
jgi:hypothetical protein